MQQDTAALRETPIEFTGSGKEYFGIWIVNILLTIVTLGIYSAWAKVRRRKYFYNNTLLDGSPFDYLARPVAILKGWLIAAAVLIAYKVSSDIYPAVSALILLLIILITPWVVVRSMRFNLVNTSYRNVRFNFKKNYQGSAAVFLGWLAVTVLTAGLAFPYYFYRQKKFVLDNAGYAQDSFGLTELGKRFYLLFLKLAGIVVLFFLVLFGVAAAVGYGAAMAGIETESVSNVTGGVANFATYLFMLLLFAYFEVRKNNLIWNHARLGQHRFKSEMKVWPMFLIYLTNLFAIVFSIGLLIPWAEIRTTRYRLQHTKMLVAQSLDGYVAERLDEQNALGDQLSEAFDIEIGL